MSERPLYIAVAGNIGAGKSSFLDWLGAKYDVELLPEPNEQNPFLERYYADMPRWAFHSQVFFLTRKLAVQRTITGSSRAVIQDRCIWEDANIFARHLANVGFMAADEYDTYRALFDAMTEHLRVPDLLIFLRCPVPVLRRMIRQRGRTMEKAISPAFLTALDVLYEDWLAGWTYSPHLVIPTDRIDPVSHLFDQQDTLALMDRHLRRRDGHRSA
jgi:deoxyadenosine/deoxycytidine kinase